MKRLMGLFIACFVLGVFVLPASAQSDSATATDCWFKNGSAYHIDCAYITVPEDHNKPEGATIQLAVAVIHSINETPEADPVLYISGGPGQALVRQAPAMIQFGIAPILMKRDVILVDQRGMGLSKPNLVCNPFENTSDAFPSALALASMVQRVAQCPSKFEAEGINWRAYSSEQNAADLAMIPAALAYKKYNIYAVSYGTIPGQIILRDYPENVRSVVLDSVAALDSNMFEDAPFGFQQSFAVMEARCKADFTCNLAYPNIRETFYETFNRLKEQPVTLTIDGREIPITAELFADYIKVQLQAISSVQTVPGLITAFAVKDYDVVIPFIEPLLESPVDNLPNQAYYMTMACPQSTPYTSVEAITKAQAIYEEPFRAASSGVTNFLECQLWKGIPAQSLELAKSDIPTLLMAGEYDPATPPESAYEAAKYLSHSYVMVLPNTSHGVASGTCGQTLMVKFYDNPMQTPDSSCMNEINAPGFILHTTVTRPPIEVALVIMGLIAIFGLAQTLFAGIIGFRRIAWWASFRRMGYMPLIAAAILYFFIVINAHVLPAELVKLGVVQSLMPILIALQATAVFSARDEPALEIQLVSPRAISWLVLERLLVVFITYGLIAAGGVALTLWVDPTVDFVMLAFSWIAPALFLSGLGVFITIRSRNIGLGVITIGFLWFMFALFSEFFLPGKSFAPPLNLIQPFMWPIHVHATLNDLTTFDYWINRLFMSATGIALIMSAVYGLRDTEQVLLNVRHKRRQKKAENHVELAASLKPQFTLQAVTVRVQILAQIFAIMKYEFIMRWRTRGIKVFILAPIAAFVIVTLVMGNDISGILPDRSREALMTAAQSGLIRGENLALIASTVIFVLAIYMYPLLVADAIPTDERIRIDEIIGALPLSDLVYIVGKILGVAAAGLVSLLSTLLGIALIYRFWIGEFYPVPYLDAVAGISSALIVMTAIAVFVGASQKTSRRAVAVVIALLILPEFFQSVPFIRWLLPSRIDFMLMYIQQSMKAILIFPPSEHQVVVTSPAFMHLILVSLVQLVIAASFVILWRHYRSQS